MPEVPAYILDPRSSEEGYISICEIECGSILAQAALRKERESIDRLYPGNTPERKAALKRLRKLAAYLQVQ
jgi:hypothetical protein